MSAPLGDEIRLGRRRFLQLGGATVLSAAVLGACSGAHPGDPGLPVSTSTTAAPDTGNDVRILRTASSLEHYIVGVYMEAAGLNLLKTPASLEMVKLFADHHSQHAAAFEGATARIGGQPFTQANPVLSRMAGARIAGLRSETDVLRLAYEMESIAAATYFSTTGVLVERPVDATMTSVAAVEARHVAVLGAVLDGVVPPSGAGTPAYDATGFATTVGAMTPGTGV